MSPKKILIVSGEPSGDLHASNLVKDLKRLDPGLEFFGLGGSLSREAGVEIIFDITELALIGYVDVLKNIAVVGRAYKCVLSKIGSVKPDLVILVDYPGFNLRLAKELKARSIPVVYYISPQIWAWGADRIKIIRRCAEKVLVFFKFEEELYRAQGVNAEFVGHPLLDIVKTTLSRDEVLRKYKISPGMRVIALLAGSRESELKSLLPVMVGACKIIAQRFGDIQLIISRRPDLAGHLYEDPVRGLGLDFRFAEGDLHNILAAADFAVVASGTATLETAIIGTPFVIAYKVGLLTYALYKLVSRIRFLGLVNVIAGREIVPELLQYDATPEKIADKVLEILSDEDRLSTMRKDLARVKASLGSPGASERAARAILPLLR